MQTFLSAQHKTALAAAALAAVLLGPGTVAGAAAAGAHGASPERGAVTVAGGPHGKPAHQAKNGNIWGP
ncbi:hypothetical protein QRN89_19285 [Streptomyces chengbuensis]|uniref:hypothetical protein n=1 Tax=Streptomyces TaxID=1883 RepID=UPI0025B30736|nr:hypothetical protein [Streptomyces sp. HUAS CB01]WJY51749.1 hypothetical protein QRN89_19285 [Streptomyces sp. HUAS CB01]